VLAAAGVALTQQILLTIAGQVVPDASGLFGAPLPVGHALDLIGLSSASFLWPVCIINVLVTGVIVWLLALWLGGQLWRGVTIVAAVTLVGLGAVGAGHQLQLLGWQVSQLSLWSWAHSIVWLLGLAALASVWGTFRPVARGPRAPSAGASKPQ